MAITGLYLEPDTAPYTSTTLSTDADITDSVRFTEARAAWWSQHYSYGVDFGAEVEITKLVVYGVVASGFIPTDWFSSNHDSFKVYKSNDNSTWIHIEDFAAPPIIHTGDGEWGFELVFSSSSQTSRYFKIVCIDVAVAFAPGGLSAKIGEIEYELYTLEWNENQKLKLTIDSSKVDEDLTNFPVNITLSSGTGQTGFDATEIFDELSTISGTKNIAITDSNDNQLYVEIERWDWVNEEANLWVKVPTIVSGTNTELHLYYDATVSGNTTYIGDTGSTPAQNVWNSNFVAVWHMAQDPNGDVADAIKDSTSNVNHGTPGGAMTSADLVDGKVGKAIEFDGVNDKIVTSNPRITGGSVTVELVCKATGTVAQYDAPLAGPNTAAIGDIVIYANNSTNTSIWITDVGVRNSLTADYSDYVHLAVTIESSSNIMLYNLSAGTSDADTYATTTVPANINIGQWASLAARTWPGIVDEVRISDTTRSYAWLKATYHSNEDDLITLSESVIFVFSNPVPTDLSTVYGVTQQLYLTTTVEPSYVYNATFYNASDDSMISSTVSGTQSGQPAGVIMNTPLGINYQWYVTATSSGSQDTSSTYTFINRFLYEGYVTEKNIPVNRVVRLYYRNTGELVDTTTSSGIGGYYKMGALNNDKHFIVAFDDDVGDSYNALILDRLLPAGV